MTPPCRAATSVASYWCPNHHAAVQELFQQPNTLPIGQPYAGTGAGSVMVQRVGSICGQVHIQLPSWTLGSGE